MNLSQNALEVIRKRYLLRDYNGNVIEKPEQMLRRVAKHVASADSTYGKNPRKTEEEFFQIMDNLEFLPNSPCLMNAGTKIGQLAACFVLPVEDSIESIFDAVKDMALVHQSGGGTGFSFSKLRPKGDIVKSTKGIASGPVSFMRVFDTATDVIKQGGKRRGANMAVLDYNHADIIEFIISKKHGLFANFNLSIGVKDDFMKKIEKDEFLKLINPRNGAAVKKIKARALFDLIVENAWNTGDPGMIFLDEVNRKHPLQVLGDIETTNPCGEVPLLAYESCVLGSLNLARFVINREIDYNRLSKVVRTAVHFLDNIIDMNKYPLEKIKEMTFADRKIGLGVMGFADMLIKLGIPYGSDKALNTAEELMRFITKEARQMSIELGAERGDFPNFSKSYWYKRYANMRNATVTTIAPTGSISIIAGCSSGIEPLFAVSYARKILDKEEMLEVNPLFQSIAKLRKFYTLSLMKSIAISGSVQNLKEVPEDIRKIFMTALEISPAWHVRMQAAFQKYTDNAVSKTVNLPAAATRKDIRRIFLLAYKLKCKGITVYRYGSKAEQVLNIGKRCEGEVCYL